MKRLNESQRKILTSIGEKFALVSGTALIFGQFVPEQRPEWQVVIIGSVLTILIILSTVFLNRNP